MAPKAAEKAEAKVAVEGEKKEGEKGKGKGAAKDKPKKSALTKSQAMAQIPSITADDDEREACSKKISWILRKGAAKVNISMSSDGWCKFTDLCNAELLEDEDKTKASEDKIMSVIDESNKQKNRYETKDTDDGKLIRAIKREDRKSSDAAAKSPAKEAKSPAKNDGALQVEPSTGLRAEAQVFKPGAGASMAGYPGMAGGYPGYGYPFGMPQMYNPYAAAYGGYPGYGGAAPAAPPAQGGSDRFQGRIKSFNAEKGYGFVESAQATQVYGRDVFLHKAHIGTFSVGAFVTFAVEMNKQGMPQARDLIGSDGVAAKGGGKGKGKGKGDGKGKEKKTKGKGKGEKKDGDKAEGEGEAKEGEAKAPDAPAAEAAAPAADA